jgi:hypothetical protein
MANLHLACKHTENFDVTRLWGAGAWRQFQEQSPTASKSPTKAPTKTPLKVPIKIKTNPQHRAEVHIEENIVVKTRSPVQQEPPAQHQQQKHHGSTISAVKTNS